MRTYRGNYENASRIFHCLIRLFFHIVVWSLFGCSRMLTAKRIKYITIETCCWIFVILRSSIASVMLGKPRALYRFVRLGAFIVCLYVEKISYADVCGVHWTLRKQNFSLRSSRQELFYVKFSFNQICHLFHLLKYWYNIKEKKVFVIDSFYLIKYSSHSCVELVSSNFIMINCNL